MGYVRRDQVEPPEEGWTRPADWPVPIVDRSGGGPLIWIVPVPEARSGRTGCTTTSSVTPRPCSPQGRPWSADADTEIEWDVLADPEGNEFCVFTPED